MLNLITLNYFLLVAWPCQQYILLQFTVQPHYPYYISYPEQKTYTNYYALFPLQNKQFPPWEVCSLDDPWSFAASHSLMQRNICQHLRCCQRKNKNLLQHFLLSYLLDILFLLRIISRLT